MTYTIQHAGLEVNDDRVKRGSQSWTRETTVTWAGHKVRTHVERDFYDKQSRIYVEVFVPAKLEWSRLQTLAGNDYGDLVSAAEKDHAKIFASTNDLVNELVAYAQGILEGVPA